ncbi:unnamed protein product, partial [Mesorhabditis spiculigera]
MDSRAWSTKLAGIESGISVSLDISGAVPFLGGLDLDFLRRKPYGLLLTIELALTVLWWVTEWQFPRRCDGPVKSMLSQYLIAVAIPLLFILLHIYRVQHKFFWFDDLNIFMIPLMFSMLTYKCFYLMLIWAIYCRVLDVWADWACGAHFLLPSFVRISTLALLLYVQMRFLYIACKSIGWVGGFPLRCYQLCIARTDGSEIYDFTDPSFIQANSRARRY